MLTERQMIILDFIVNNFIATGNPIGSRTISKASLINVSPATIRNEMADLEELGYIIQPHVSSGRIPSTRGLRFHIDHLDQVKELDDRTSEVITNLISFRKKTVEDILEQAVHSLSELTEMTAIIVAPRFNHHRLFNLKLIRVSNKKILFVLVSDNEEIKSEILELADYSQIVLDQLSDILVENFYGRAIEEIDLREILFLARSYPMYQDFFEYFIPFLKEFLTSFDQEDIYVSGREYLVRNNMNGSSEHAAKMMSLLKQKDEVLALLDSPITKTNVRIGQEIDHPLFENYSIISSSYQYGKNQNSKLALIGPIRMDYQKTMDIVEGFKRTLNSVFTGIHL